MVLRALIVCALWATVAKCSSSSSSSSTDQPKLPELPNAIHYPIYVPISGQASGNLFGSSSAFAPGGNYPAVSGPENDWIGAASATLGDWTSPLMEVYDEQQLTNQREKLRQRMEHLRARQERYRAASQRRSQHSRPRDVDPFDSYHHQDPQQPSASSVRRRLSRPSREHHSDRRSSSGSWYTRGLRRKWQSDRDRDDERDEDEDY